MLRRAILLLAVLALVGVAVAVVLGAGPLRRLDAVVVEKFNGRRWNFPSRIYSDAFVMYPGLDVAAAGLFERLQRLNYREADSDPLRKGDFRRTATGLDLFLRDFTYPGQQVDDRLIHIELAGNVIVGMRDLRS